MKYQLSILTKTLLLVVGLFFVLLLFSCKKDIKPTKEFYVNDYAKAWLKFSKNTILKESERLFEVTKDTEIGGTQIVFASFLVDSFEDTAKYDRTELYRKFEIGDNDMGILVLFFYEKVDSDLNLILVEYELGYKMEQYITASQMRILIDETIIDSPYGSPAMQLAYFLYELLTIVYVDIYGYSSFSYDMEYYEQKLYSSKSSNNDVIDIVLELFSEGKISSTALISFVVVILFGGSFSLIKNRGAGGSSGGAGGFRRKR